MRIIKFPDKFCMDSRPYWVLFALFLVSNVLLVYTLYTKQPERYRHSSQWFSFNFHPGMEKHAAQAAHGVNLPKRPQSAAPRGSPTTLASPVTDNPAVTEFLGMMLADTSLQFPAKKGSSSFRRGVRITSVKKDSLAYLSGFRKDDIIVSLNRIPTHTVGELVQIAAGCSPSEGLLFDIYRMNKRYYMTMETRDTARRSKRTA